mmetsp:Transcript_28565/g.41524  ORF Transcript_28565/g.41524 Transcript_28565/m.41524 type:complete len:199 (+) Transcript_28565:76-672(+)
METDGIKNLKSIALEGHRPACALFRRKLYCSKEIFFHPSAKRSNRAHRGQLLVPIERSQVTPLLIKTTVAAGIVRNTDGTYYIPIDETQVGLAGLPRLDGRPITVVAAGQGGKDRGATAGGEQPDKQTCPLKCRSQGASRRKQGWNGEAPTPPADPLWNDGSRNRFKVWDEKKTAAGGEVKNGSERFCCNSCRAQCVA